MPDERKTLEQRIADIEFNLKKLREEITNAYISWEGKIVLEQSPTPTPEQPKQTSAQPKKKRDLSDWGRMKSGRAAADRRCAGESGANASPVSRCRIRPRSLQNTLIKLPSSSRSSFHFYENNYVLSRSRSSVRTRSC
jgi:hypothetical protein